MAYIAPLILKNCVKCGVEMECTPKREICSVCRREMEREQKRIRALRKKNDQLAKT